MPLSDSFVRGYIKEVRTVQEQEGSTEDIFIHRTNLRGGYKTYLQKMQKLPENMQKFNNNTFSNMLFGERCTIMS